MTPLSVDAVVEYMVGYITIQQYNLKNILRIFGQNCNKAEIYN